MSNGCHASMAAGPFSTRNYYTHTADLSGFPAKLVSYYLPFDYSLKVQFAPL